MLGPQSLARPNRPHISSDIINVKEQGNKNNRQRQSLGASSQHHLQFSVCFQSLALPSASRCNHRRFGEGSSTDTRIPPQPPFSKINKLSATSTQNTRKCSAATLADRAGNSGSAPHLPLVAAQIPQPRAESRVEARIPHKGRHGDGRVAQDWHARGNLYA